MGERARLLPLLIGASGLGTFTLSLVLPFLPALQGEFGVSYAELILTQTAFLVGLALPQLFYGAISDRIGRRPAMLLGLGLFLAGSIACYFASSLTVLIAGRLAQAIGASGGMVLARAIVRDLYSIEKAASSLAYITMATVVMPMASPIIGGALFDAYGWHSAFLLTIVTGVVLIAAALFGLSETHTQREAQRWRTLFSDFGQLLTTRRFLSYALPPAFGTSVYQSSLAGAPYVFFGGAGSALELGSYFLISSSSYILGNFFAARLIMRVGVDRLLLYGTLLPLASSAAMMAFAAFDQLTVLVFFGLLCVSNIVQGTIISGAVVAASSVIPGKIGAGAGLAGAIQFGLGAVIATIGGQAAVIGPFWFATVIALCTVGSFTSFRLLRTRTP